MKGLHTVGITPSYTDTPVRVDILKRNSNLKSFEDDLEVLPKISHVKTAKKKDVASLLKYFCTPEDAKQFYDDVMQETTNIVLNDENPEGAAYYDEDES